MASTAPPPTDDAPEDVSRRSGSRIGWWFAIAASLAMIGMWVYVLPREGSVKPAAWLTDRRFPTAAEPVCRRAMAELDRLTPARDSRTATDRAVVVDQGTAILRTMQRDLRPLVPAGGERAKFIEQWIDDWTAYLGDRTDYANALRKSSQAEFLETVRYGTQLSKSIDNFATVNKMDDCATPGDV